MPALSVKNLTKMFNVGLVKSMQTLSLFRSIMACTVLATSPLTINAGQEVAQIQPLLTKTRVIAAACAVGLFTLIMHRVTSSATNTPSVSVDRPTSRTTAQNQQQATPSRSLHTLKTSTPTSKPAHVPSPHPQNQQSMRVITTPQVTAKQPSRLELKAAASDIHHASMPSPMQPSVASWLPNWSAVSWNDNKPLTDSTVKTLFGCDTNVNFRKHVTKITEDGSIIDEYSVILSHVLSASTKIKARIKISSYLQARAVYIPGLYKRTAELWLGRE